VWYGLGENHTELHCPSGQFQGLAKGLGLGTSDDMNQNEAHDQPTSLSVVNVITIV
jgi:hypothetical protein